jgi:Uma2 family endonuclease
MSVAAAPQPPPPGGFRRFSVAEYHQMIRSGVLTDEDKVELLNGFVVLKMPRNPPHDARIQKLNRLFLSLLPAGWDVRVQLAVTLTLTDSEPEPDVAVVRGTADDYNSTHPVPKDIGMVVEVADSSLSRDRDEKGLIYATAGVPEYWIVNLVDRQVEVYSVPTAIGPSIRYARRVDYRAGDAISLVLDGTPIGSVAVQDLLP